MMSALRTGSIFMMAVLLFSCGTTEEAETVPYESAADQLIAEYGDTIVDRKSVDKVLELSKTVTLEWRSSGILSVVKQVEKQLKNLGKPTTSLTDIEDFTIGQALPGVEDWELAATGDTGTTSVTRTIKDTNPNKKYWECPPIKNIGKASCVMITDTAKKISLSSINPTALTATVDKLVENDALLKEESKKFRDYAKSYLENLALQTHKFGIEIGSIRAEWSMRKAAVCDNEVIDGKQIAQLRGVEESTIVLRNLVGLKDFEIRPKGSDCLKVGAHGATTDAKIKAAIKAHIEKTKKNQLMCADMSMLNPNVIEVFKQYEKGLVRGINAQLATVWVGTFRNGRPWKIKGKILVVKIDGCNPKDQIKYTTSPLVLDLDNDGLELTTKRVQFDLRATGQPQKVTWTGKREGFLALDLNKDGQITSGRELFGNRTLCGVERCADGAAALAMHDKNADGRIDAKDAVFSSLRIWVDGNHDGTTQSEEMQSLAQHGIKSFSLKANYVNRTVVGGKISLTLQVKTSKGTRTAYDVWFKNNAAPGFATPLF